MTDEQQTPPPGYIPQQDLGEDQKPGIVERDGDLIAEAEALVGEANDADGVADDDDDDKPESD